MEIKFKNSRNLILNTKKFLLCSMLVNPTYLLFRFLCSDRSRSVDFFQVLRVSNVVFYDFQISEGPFETGTEFIKKTYG